MNHGRPHRIVAAAEAALPRDARERFEERAAIREFEGGFSREEAERLALKDCGLMPAGTSAEAAP